jgi:hypothetical protein
MQLNKMAATTAEQIGTKSTLRPNAFFMLSYRTNQLYRTGNRTGALSCNQVPGYEIKFGCCWNEVSGGNLVITGGEDHGSRTVVKIDTLRECAVSSLPPMHTPRYNHAAEFHSQCLYVLGGEYGQACLRECERYVFAESRWEVLPALPVAGGGMSAVVLDNCLFALGGSHHRLLDTVQMLSLDCLTWEIMQLKLPQAVGWFPCFRTDTQVYLLIKGTLYSFTPLQFKVVKTLPESISCVASYFLNGTLYYAWYGEVMTLSVGSLA